MKHQLSAPRSWYYVFCASDVENPMNPTLNQPINPTLFLSLGRKITYYYEKESWKRIIDMKLELPSNTLIYAEIVHECINEYKQLRKVSVLHILDACKLGGDDVSRDYIEVRHNKIKKFCKALQKPVSDTIQVRAKDIQLLDSEFKEALNMPTRVLKKGQKALAYELPKPLNAVPMMNDTKPYYIPNSVVFLRSTTDLWSRHLGKSSPYKYLYNRLTQKSVHNSDRPADATAPFKLTYAKRSVWYWPNHNKLPKEKFLDILEENLKF